MRERERKVESFRVTRKSETPRRVERMILSSKDEGDEKLERRITRISWAQAAGGGGRVARDN